MYNLLNFRDKLILMPIVGVFIILFGQAAVSGIGGILTILLAVLLVFKKKNLVMLLLILTILTFSDSRSGFLGFAQQIKPLLIVLLGFAAFFNQRKNEIFPLLIPFFIVAFICIFWSPTPSISFQKTLSLLLLYLATPVIIHDIITRAKSPRVLKLIMLVPLVILVVGLVIHVVNPSFTTLAARYRGLLGNPNGLGIFVTVYFLLFQVLKAAFKNLFSSKEHYLIMGLIIVSLLLSQSRTAMTVVILYYAFYWVFRFRLLAALFLCILLFLVGIVFVNNIEPIVLALGLEEFLRLDTLEDGSGRTIARAFAWYNILESPLIGRGFTYTEYVFTQNRYALSRLDHQGNAHNSYLTMWLDTGLIGMLLYFGVLLRLFIKGFVQYRLSLPVFFCFAFSAFNESWLVASLNPFTIIFCIILTLLLIPKEKLNAMNQSESVDSTPNPLHA